MKRLSGKNAFISGSSRGIGLACAKALAEQGANVFLVATNEALLKEATSVIQQRSAVQVGSQFKYEGFGCFKRMITRPKHDIWSYQDIISYSNFTFTSSIDHYI